MEASGRGPISPASSLWHNSEKPPRVSGVRKSSRKNQTKEGSTLTHKNIPGDSRRSGEPKQEASDYESSLAHVRTDGDGDDRWFSVKGDAGLGGAGTRYPQACSGGNGTAVVQ